jgi:hypothetical protein
MCAAPANQSDVGHWIYPGLINDVELYNLKPDTDYYYQFGSSAGW